jgi:hypothetical protein
MERKGEPGGRWNLWVWKRKQTFGLKPGGAVVDETRSFGVSGLWWGERAEFMRAGGSVGRKPVAHGSSANADPLRG